MIYLDNAATTKPLTEALEQAENFLKDNYFNPSASYGAAVAVRKAVEKARDAIASRFSDGYEVVFTSGGSESDSTAIFSRSLKGNFITTEGEHSAVYESFNELKRRGAEVRFAPLNKDGSVNTEKLLSLVDEGTQLVSVVHVNNETGAINDINRLADEVKKINPSAYFHSDGVQAFGKIPFKFSKNIDFYSVSAHKIGAIKGTGALIKKKISALHPLIHGGGQERGFRSGTENVFGINVFASAAEIKYAKISENYQKVVSLKNAFKAALGGDIEVLSGENSSPYILSLSAKGLRGEVLQRMMEESGVIIGTGSACSSKLPHSRILTRCGYSNDVLDGAIRISFTDTNETEEVVFAAQKLNECVERLKKVVRKR